MNKKLSHFDARGAARMVDVGEKPLTHRVAVASGRITMRPATFRMVAAGSAKKGDVLGVARIAAIQAAKRTDEWIPLCHTLPLDSIEVDLLPDPAGSRVRIEARAAVHARTGVEMEALTAVAGACLALAIARRDASAPVHWRLAREIASLPGALGGLAALAAGRAWPRPPRPVRSLA